MKALIRAADPKHARLLESVFLAAVAGWVAVEGPRTIQRRASLGRPKIEVAIICRAEGEPIVEGRSLEYWLLMMDHDRRAAAVLETHAQDLAPILGERLVEAVLNPVTGLSTPAFSPRTRWLAASALLRLGTNAAGAVPALTRALHSSDRQTSLLAAEALGSIGAASAPAVPDLIRVGRRGGGNYQHQVLKALGRIGPVATNATCLLLEALNARSEHTVLFASEALWAIRQEPRLVEASLAALMTSEDAAVQRGARILWGEIQSLVRDHALPELAAIPTSVGEPGRGSVEY